MPVLAAFLKGTVSENLSKLVQPAGTVPATIFVLLNLAFVYPTARADGVGIATTFSNLTPTWQAVVAAALILAIGYLLLNSSNAIVDTLAGDSWRGSLLHSFLTWWQDKRRRRLLGRLAAAEAAEDGARPAALRWELATTFPPADTGTHYLQPTRLGNTLSATQHVIHRRYGIDMTALWSQLQSSQALKDSPALAAVKDDESTLDVLANLVFVLSVFAFEALVFFALRRRWDDALLSLLLLPLVFIAYRVAVSAARAWGDGVAGLFDLHRDDLRSELNLRAPTDTDDERELWEKATQFFLPGGEAVPANELFDPTPPAPPVITASGRLTVTPISSSPVEGERSSTGGALALSQLDQVLVVARAGKAGRYADAQFVVDDARLVAIDGGDLPQEIRAGVVSAVPTVLSYPGGARLVWRISGLGKDGSLTLAYRLPLWRVEVEPSFAIEVASYGEEIEILLPPPMRGQMVKFIITSFGPVTPPQAPKLKLGVTQVPLMPDPVTGRAFSDTVSVAANETTAWVTLP